MYTETVHQISYIQASHKAETSCEIIFLLLCVCFLYFIYLLLCDLFGFLCAHNDLIVFVWYAAFSAKERSTASSLDLYFANDGLNIMSTKVSY